jgi:hypothetical protein
MIPLSSWTMDVQSSLQILSAKPDYFQGISDKRPPLTIAVAVTQRSPLQGTRVPGSRSCCEPKRPFILLPLRRTDVSVRRQIAWLSPPIRPRYSPANQRKGSFAACFRAPLSILTIRGRLRRSRFKRHIDPAESSRRRTVPSPLGGSPISGQCSGVRIESSSFGGRGRGETSQDEA